MALNNCEPSKLDEAQLGEALPEPVLAWPTPADIVYGTALGATQLNATANVAGAFAYTPAAGAVLNAGAGQTLSVNFTPTDTANYNGVTATAQINVLKANPGLTWTNPMDITYGTALSTTQLNAKASVAGTFAYTPALGAVLPAGPGQMLSVSFTPTDTADYTRASANVLINVARMTQTITFGPLADRTQNDPPFPVSATASSGLPVSFVIASGPATIAGNMITISGVGTVVVRASQPGNANYTAAPSTDQSFAVRPSLRGRMEGDGFIDGAGRRHHFEFEVEQLADGTRRGRVSYRVRDHRPGDRDDDRDDRSAGRGHHERFHSTALTSVVFSDKPAVQPGRRSQPIADTVVVTGTGSWNGLGRYTFEMRATDAGEPGRGRDTFSITVRAPDGGVVATVGGALTGGNNQSQLPRH